MGIAAVKIIGFGNKYRSDDGIGIRVIEELKELSSTDPFFCNRYDIEIIDGGTSAINLISLLKETPKIIIIDAVDAGQDTGGIKIFKEKEIGSFLEGEVKSLSMHDLDLGEVFKLIRALKIPSDITIIGIRPKNTDLGEELSPEVERRVGDIVAAVKKEIRNCQ